MLASTRSPTKGRYMALREKLAERITPMLEPGETIQHVWLAQSGMSPYLLAGIGGAVAMLFNKYFVVAATDRAILLCSAGKLAPSKPKAVVKRLPRDAKLELNGKVWGKGDLAGTTYYVHRRFFGDVEAANRAAA
jgi:hypothetical protein